MKPILFNTEMVKAILDGRKTQTRRIVKPQPTFDAAFRGGWVHENKKATTSLMSFNEGLYPNMAKYQVGDVLYVRETMYFDDVDQSFYYKANYTEIEIADFFVKLNLKATPSTHMPKEAARIFLKVTNVRVERVQDITTADAIKEGIARHGLYNEECYAGGCYNGDFETTCAVCNVPIDGFKLCWNSIYGNWAENPWVWVYEFERCERSL